MNRPIAVILIIGLAVTGLACGGGSGPSPQDWLVGDWQMYECENITTGERVAAATLGVGGGASYSANHSWEAWREGWPGGRVEGFGAWKLIAQNLYQLTSENRTSVISRSGDEWYSVGGFDGAVYYFWYRRGAG